MSDTNNTYEIPLYIAVPKPKTPKQFIKGLYGEKKSITLIQGVSLRQAGVSNGFNGEYDAIFNIVLYAATLGIGLGTSKFVAKITEEIFDQLYIVLKEHLFEAKVNDEVQLKSKEEWVEFLNKVINDKNITVNVVANNNQVTAGNINSEITQNIIRYKFIYSMSGQLLVCVSIIGGIILFLNGVGGSTDWTANILGNESTINDAGAGSILFIVGLFILIVTRLKISTKAIGRVNAVGCIDTIYKANKLLEQIIKEQQNQYVRKSYGEGSTECFTWDDLTRFKQENTIKQIFNRLTQSSKFDELVTVMGIIPEDKHKDIYYKGRHIYKKTWGELGEISISGQTDAGQKAEKMIADGIVELIQNHIS